MVNTAAVLGIVAISAVASSAAAARSLEALQAPDPAREAAAPADAGFAASCREAARGLLGQGSFSFERPAYTARDGEAIVRMEVGVPGLGRDGLFRAVCVRDRRSGTVEAAVFDAPADGIGPRVIVLAGPEGGGPAPPDYVIAFNPSDPDAEFAYGGYGGFWSPFRVGCGPFDGARRHRSSRKGPALDPNRPVPEQPRFGTRMQRGSGGKGGLSGSGFGGGVRLGTGGFIR